MTGPGEGIVRASWVGTAAFALTAAAAAAAPPADLVALTVALTLFAAGSVVFLAAYVRAVRRSRRDEIDLGGLFFLSGSAPPTHRRLLLGSLAAEVAVAVVSAAVRPNTSLAFGVLVPVYGLGMCAFWAAGHGTFPPRGQGLARKHARRGVADAARDWRGTTP